MNSLLHLITRPRKLHCLMASLLSSINTSGLLCCSVGFHQTTEPKTAEIKVDFGLFADTNLLFLVFFFLFLFAFFFFQVGSSLLMFHSGIGFEKSYISTEKL